VNVNITDCVFELGKLQKENAALRKRLESSESIRHAEKEILIKEIEANKNLRERLARLAELLQEILEHDVANLNTEHEFFACHTYGSKNMPVWVEKAKRAIADAKEAK
jgi:hypothetical protein